MTVLALAGLLLAASGADCIWPWQTPDDNKPRLTTLRGFDSAEELRQFLADQANARVNTYRGGGGGGLWFFDMVPLPAAPTSNSSMDTTGAPESGGGGQTSYSTTNIQEAGVDESDIVKNDDQTIYWLRGSTIHVVKAIPADGMSELATITLDAPGNAMYLRGHQLVGLSTNWNYTAYSDWSGGSSSGSVGGGATEPGSPPTSTNDEPVKAASILPPGGPWFDGSETIVTVLDVSNPASPATQATLKFEGQLADSRLIDNHLYLVLITTPRLPVDPTPLAIDGMTLDQWLPAYQIDAGGQTQTGSTTSWQSFYRPDAGDGYGITTVVTIDLNNPSGQFASTAITADAGVIYASTQALYVTDVNYDWSLYTSRTDTMIHKLAFTENGADYVASGLVPGRPLNQYSLGENEGYLRIATTVDNFDFFDGGGSSTNAVYVLGVSGTDLNVVGKVEDLGIGEQIYAARFLGPRGFLVTFKRIDPLFTMDLSDPTNPRVVGQLKVPGYSDHIQLLDENHLLTIGKDAQEAGDWGAWVQGVKLSIVDVSDMANPQETKTAIIGGRGTNSEANYNPKAFNYFPDKGALAFPIELYSSGTTGPEYGQHEFTGLLVYSVSADSGFQELGRISTVPETVPNNGCYWGYYGSSRGVFIGDNVYAVSDLGVESAAIATASSVVDTVDFTDSQPAESCYWIEPLILPEESEGLR